MCRKKICEERAWFCSVKTYIAVNRVLLKVQRMAEDIAENFLVLIKPSSKKEKEKKKKKKEKRKKKKQKRKKKKEKKKMPGSLVEFISRKESKCGYNGLFVLIDPPRPSTCRQENTSLHHSALGILDVSCLSEGHITVY